MEWVAIDVHIAGNSVTHRLAEQFKLRVAEAAGLLALTFAGMAEHAVDGNMATVTNSQIEAWAHWHGKRGRYAEFFRTELCDENGLVTKWEEYNGASMRAAQSSRERSQRWRAERRKVREERERAAHETALRTAFGTADETRDERGLERPANASTGPDLTGPHPEPLAELSAGGELKTAKLTPLDSPDGTALAAAMGDADIAPVLDFISGRPFEDWVKWCRALLQIIGPATGVLPCDLSGGCCDALLEHATTPVAIRAFAVRRKDERMKVVRADLPRSASTTSGAEQSDEAAWSAALEAVANLQRGLITADVYATLPAPLRAGLKRVGGWTALRDARPADLPFRRKEFLAGYHATPHTVSA